ncbi:Dienelactone hydrolase family protein OS=Singulisphaera acidiphila (strain ATCC BAA-1392 / DSM 18658 / VKM B-2454 / MOB10) GN=Sinac_2221 PE=4 SV=1: Abhydrolase_5 [Gemmataceae bacterium]|nr:Dienelactone hydrolase family protein OS=Singulisphaera acidiphila (strain ATCC BAA-1392 / DSM 18658 / VKM B-2454 / MOB10) GN=Sinac_2221 PE=4 SV=1: Abhydrolase_5 [Gemmataceae bacterium]VTU00652.1 Dienelactone hydrolase family protein OS=Singulisphaera acidiphila (strain ATCC BAA-1392 / DSM 18658 / VKM B-2454 / MOB10) GN=Sinac_2221 PE=4 SV=1: Abhydrolase_5 [Gemmataceae bacterium]
MRTRLLLAVTVVTASLTVGSRPPLARGAEPLPPEKAKAALLKLLDRPKVPADVREDAKPVEKGGLTYTRWSFASEKKADGTVERVPVLMVAPTDRTGKLPVVVVLHGTGGNKDGLVSWLEDFAKQGVIGVAIDARYHGDRSGGAKGAAAYVEAITKAWKAPAGQPHEHPFFYDTVWDLWRLVDVLESHEAIDGKKIGMLGISMGGIQTWLAASVDDRVVVAAPLIAAQSFKWSLDNDKWQGRANTIKAAHEAAAKDLGEAAVNQRVCRELWGKVIPGILDDFDCPNLIRLFAGRALFIANGDKDANCPIEGAKLAIAAAEDAFAKAGAKDKLVVRINAGVGHSVTPDDRKEAIAFCVKWLK